MHDSVVRRIQGLTFELLGDDGDRPGGFVADEAARVMFAGELATFVIEGIAVAVVGMRAVHAHMAIFFIATHLAIIRDVAPN